MSAICIAVLQIDGPALIDCCDLAILEEEHGIGIRFDGFYVEPFLESYRSIGGRLIKALNAFNGHICRHVDDLFRRFSMLAHVAFRPSFFGLVA